MDRNSLYNRLNLKVKFVWIQIFPLLFSSYFQFLNLVFIAWIMALKPIFRFVTSFYVDFRHTWDKFLSWSASDVKVQPEQQTSPWYAREAWLYLQTINYNFRIGIVFIWSEPSVSELLVDEICLPSLRILLSRLRYLTVIYILCYRPKHQFTTVKYMFHFLRGFQFTSIILQLLLWLLSTSGIFTKRKW